MGTRTRTIVVSIALFASISTSARSDDCAEGLKPESPIKDILACLKEQSAALRSLRENTASGIPAGVVIAFDDPAGCAKLGKGWEDARFDGQILVGATEAIPRWNYRKAGGSTDIAIKDVNIPPLYLGYRTAQSGPGITLSMVEDLSFSRPRSPSVLQTSASAAQPIDIMPPYIPIYFCKRS
jgi:hypothetical protein